VLGGISANRHVCGTLAKPGWWQDLAGPGRPLDTQRYRVLSFDFFPGNQDLAENLLSITPNDQARIARVVCDYFGIQQLHAFIGASYGGMVALSFGAQFPDCVARLIVACAAHRPHPMGTAWRSIQRKIVQFGLETCQPERALGLARELGMTTYRTAEEFGERFSATSTTQTDNDAPQNRSSVEEYLETRGQAFIGRMSPERYLALSKSIDLHAIDPKQVQVPVTFISCRQDQLVPVEEVRLLHRELPKKGALIEFDSIYGHDAFLKEPKFLGQVLTRILNS
jgi:homoserine O-acetyltransferase